MITIVTPWLDCLELIPAYEDAVRSAAVVIVDQASAAPTADALDAMTERLGGRIVHLPHNVHYAAGNNLGLAMVETPVVVFLNNDVQRGNGVPWLDAVARDVQPGGIYGPSVQPFDVDGIPYPYVEGWCMAGATEDFRRVGGWNDRDFPRAYVEDVELCWRARRHGIGLYQTRWAIEHLSNYTNSRIPGAYDHADAQRETFRRMVREARTA